MKYQNISEFGETLIMDESFAIEFMEAMIDDIVEKSIKTNNNLNNYKDKMVFVAKTFGKINLEHILKYAESPIEKLFLYSLLVSSLQVSFKYKNLSFLTNFEPPVNDPLTYIKNKTEHYQELIEAYKIFHEKTNGDYQDFEQAIINNNNLNEEQKKLVNIDVVIYLGFDFYHKIHIMPQPCFKDIDRKGKTIRADMLIWYPPKQNVKLIIECDGYEFHNAKDAFIKDRKRDRDFKINGIDVMRFSGTEIKNDYISISYEVIETLAKTMLN